MPGKSKKASKRSEEDRSRERAIRQMVELLERNNVRVRRERLRSGPGWKAASGPCRINNDKMLFVDRALPLEEQADILSFRLRAFKNALNAEDLGELPDHVQRIVLGD